MQGLTGPRSLPDSRVLCRQYHHDGREQGACRGALQRVQNVPDGPDGPLQYVVSGANFDMTFLLLAIQSAFCVLAVTLVKRLGIISCGPYSG